MDEFQESAWPDVSVLRDRTEVKDEPLNGVLPDPDAKPRPVPWNMFDVGLIAFVFFFAPSLLMSLILVLPCGYRFFLIQTEDERTIVWSKPKELHKETPKETVSPDDLSEDDLPQEKLPQEKLTGPDVQLVRTGTATPARAIGAVETGSREDCCYSALLESEPWKQEQPTDDFSASGEEAERLRLAHPLAELIVLARDTSRYPFVLGLVFFAAVVVAPLVEEFVFRVVFQGALERHIAETPDASAKLARARILTAILIPAFVFATIHYRPPNSTFDFELLLLSIVVSPIGLLFTLAFGIAWLGIVRHATRRDFGIVWRDVPLDFIKGIGFFLLLAPALIVVMVLLERLCPDTVTDPIPIFILALGLGTVYFKTHRYASIVGMHGALNLTSFLMLVLH